MQQRSNLSIDILIKGGGLVGLLAALALSKAGFKVRVEEKNLSTLERPENDAYNMRVSCITPVSVKIFQALGAWENIQKTGVSPFETIKVWEESPEQALNFDGKAIGANPLGYIIENDVMKKALLEAYASYNDVTLSSEATFSPQEVGLKAKLLVAADGANSESRQQAGIACRCKAYGQYALVAHIHTSQPHQRIARQRFLSSGPLGFLPLSDPHHCSIVWSHQADQAKALAVMPESKFNQALQEALGNELGELRLISRRLIFPLYMQEAESYIKPRFALIGDAAHTVHPLAGYGVNMGFLDAMTLTAILKKARSQNRDIGGLQTLRRYERIRKSENLLMLKVIDSFTLPLARRWGITVTKRSQWLRNIFMKWMSHHGEENAVI